MHFPDQREHCPSWPTRPANQPLSLASPGPPHSGAALLAILSVLCVGLAVRYATHPSYVADPQPERPAGFDRLEDRVDPNTADVTTLTAVPGLGAKRGEIVRFREGRRARRPGEVVFKTAEDLMVIRGIGPAMVDNLRPYLVFSRRVRPPFRRGAGRAGAARDDVAWQPVRFYRCSRSQFTVSSPLNGATVTVSEWRRSSTPRRRRSARSASPSSRCSCRGRRGRRRRGRRRRRSWRSRAGSWAGRCCRRRRT